MPMYRQSQHTQTRRSDANVFEKKGTKAVHDWRNNLSPIHPHVNRRSGFRNP
jgi:hypothetical protein